MLADNDTEADGTKATSLREVVLLGSTGSVGTQAVQVIRQHRTSFRVRGLATGGARAELLAEQVLDLEPEVVAVADPTAEQPLRAALAAEAKHRGGARPTPQVLTGADGVAAVAAWDADVVLNGIDGALGLASTMAALRAGNTLALANKESLIVGGELVTGLAQPGQIVPVDSEHAAIAQCLRAGRHGEVRRLIITATGGPFRGRRQSELTKVTPTEALAHPTWSMGPVITINSATLVNKGLEVIEAHLLFGIGFEDIEVLLHPTSEIHSMVEFHDGAVIAQVSPPDMRLPIAFGLGWPNRLSDVARSFNWRQPHRWELLPLDNEAFPAVELARQVGRDGGGAPAVYNAANEVCVRRFLAGRLRFPDIVDTVARVVGEFRPETITDVAGILAVDAWARTRADEVARDHEI